MAIVTVFLSILVVLPIVLADTPANCTYDDIVGRWVFTVSISGGSNNTLNCSRPGEFDHVVIVDLQFPDVAFDVTYGHKGYWTLIYNQGFEVVLNNKKYFAFSKYVKEGEKYKSICDETMPGWSHNVVGTDWACYVGKKKQTKHHPQSGTPADPKKLFKTDYDFINKINSAQNSWKAVVYPEYEKLTIEEMLRRRGGRASMMASKPSPAPVTEKVRKLAKTLPLSFDWRNVNGRDFLTFVRDQMTCGSCYVFASLGMHEARLHIASNNTYLVVMSPQEVVSCSEYSQGCEGGFPYLVAGKYAEDFGIIENSCFRYVGKDTPCKKTNCMRYYATDYRYVGGFFGGCNEELMRIALVKNGPMAVSFEVYQDFESYKGGIYHHVGLAGDRLGHRFDPFELTNHAVLVVGYGADPVTGEKFWIVQNSWGESWGEKGYFRIRRGTDECAIESMAVESFPIFP